MERAEDAQVSCVFPKMTFLRLERRLPQQQTHADGFKFFWKAQPKKGTLFILKLYAYIK